MAVNPSHAANSYAKFRRARIRQPDDLIITRAPPSVAAGSAGRGAGVRLTRRRRRWRGPRRPGGSSFRRRQFGAVEQHDVDRLGRLADVEDRVRAPVDAGLPAMRDSARGRSRARGRPRIRLITTGGRRRRQRLRSKTRDVNALSWRRRRSRWGRLLRAPDKCQGCCHQEHRRDRS
jgi:hypothetical protein